MKIYRKEIIIETTEYKVHSMLLHFVLVAKSIDELNNIRIGKHCWKDHNVVWKGETEIINTDVKKISDLPETTHINFGDEMKGG